MCIRDSFWTYHLDRLLLRVDAQDLRGIGWGKIDFAIRAHGACSPILHGPYHFWTYLHGPYHFWTYHLDRLLLRVDAQDLHGQVGGKVDFAIRTYGACIYILEVPFPFCPMAGFGHYLQPNP